ncbi:MAG: DUF2125 domain-containing protein [Rhodoblastus sp.]
MSDDLPDRKFSTVRRVLALLVFACVFLTIGWSIYWYVAQRLALGEFHAQIAREAQHGRFWSCASVESKGYPLAVSIDCDAPKLRIEYRTGPRTISTQHASIRAGLHAPTLVEIDLRGPASFEGDANKVEFDWTALRVDLRGLPARLDRLSIVGRDLVVRPAGSPATKIETLHAHLKRTAPVSMAPYGVTLGFAGVESPDIAALLGPGEPALATLTGAITQLDAAGAGHWADRLEAWRAAGGLFSVAALTLTRGALSVQGEGLVALDQQHRPVGKLSTNLRNAGPALLALAEAAGKLDRNTIAGQLAAGVLGRPGDLKFNISAENGALSIGPLRRALLLPPLY